MPHIPYIVPRRIKLVIHKQGAVLNDWIFLGYMGGEQSWRNDADDFILFMCVN